MLRECSLAFHGALSKARVPQFGLSKHFFMFKFEGSLDQCLLLASFNIAAINVWILRVLFAPEPRAESKNAPAKRKNINKWIFNVHISIFVGRVSGLCNEILKRFPHTTTSNKNEFFFSIDWNWFLTQSFDNPSLRGPVHCVKIKFK